LFYAWLWGEGMFANQYFAEFLASKGIVSLIQDKRVLANQQVIGKQPTLMI